MRDGMRSETCGGFVTSLDAHLLDVRRKLKEGLRVRQDGPGLVPHEGDVPHAEETHEHRHVPLERRVEEVLVHASGPCETRDITTNKKLKQGSYRKAETVQKKTKQRKP